MRRARVALARGRRCPCTARPPARRRRRRRRRNFARRVVYTMLCIALGVHAACLLHFLRARLRGPPPPSAPFARPAAHPLHAPAARRGAAWPPRAHHGVYPNPDISCSTASARARPSSARRRRPPSPPPSRRAARRATPAHRHRPAAPPLTAAAALLITPTARRRAAQHCISCGS